MGERAGQLLLDYGTPPDANPLPVFAAP